MKFLKQIQDSLEEFYGAKTGLNVMDFVRPTEGNRRKGELLVEQNPQSEDINLALLLDVDILEAWQSFSKPDKEEQVSVPIEEVSHFVYLAFNHNRGRNITQLEMEIQSEVDRVLLAFHGSFEFDSQVQTSILNSLFEKSYTSQNYEEARLASAQFLRTLCQRNPKDWTRLDFERLRRFFHNDLPGKMLLSQEKSRKVTSNS